MLRRFSSLYAIGPLRKALHRVAKPDLYVTVLRGIRVPSPGQKLIQASIGTQLGMEYGFQPWELL
jgi:hypothetical protein